ncbi:unnamed protein product, partial [Effrenium voratum]
MANQPTVDHSWTGIWAPQHIVGRARLITANRGADGWHFHSSEKSKSAAKGPQTEMEYEFGADLDFVYPLEASSCAWRLTPEEDVEEEETPQQLFLNRAKALITADANASKPKVQKPSCRKEDLIWFREACEEHLATASGSSSGSSMT